MNLRPWEKLPEFMKCDEVRPYYDILLQKQWSLRIKRFVDVVLSLFLIIVLLIPMIVIGLLIVIDSGIPVIYRQERVTAYGRHFYIHKFRTMKQHSESETSELTAQGNPYITRIGKILRNCRLDELPQLFDVLSGNMTFVGTRPEVPQYVSHYSKEMNATLLLPAGITNAASIQYRHEDELLKNSTDIRKTYIEEILPEKMKINLAELCNVSLSHDFLIMLKTITGAKTL